jgi:hypothetical protein
MWRRQVIVDVSGPGRMLAAGRVGLTATARFDAPHGLPTESMCQ